MIDIVDLHHLPSEPTTPVFAVEGDAWRLDEDGNRRMRLGSGQELCVGESIYLEPSARVRVGSLELLGGKRGRAHSFIDRSAAISAPNRSDVPRLVRDLTRLEQHMMEHFDEDPLTNEHRPTTPFERSVASDFAFMNLDLEAALKLDEATAREHTAVCLFLAGESACVAIQEVSVRKIRTLMETLKRPVNPHVVADDTIHCLIETVYGKPDLMA